MECSGPISGYTSVVDLWHFNTDPDPRICNQDPDPAFFVKKNYFFNVFLFITFWRYIYISF